MAASTQWEVVGKSSKKGKAQGQSNPKSHKKAFLENAPKIEVADPVKESPTIYDAFWEKERKESQRMEQTPNGKDHAKGSTDTSSKNKGKEPIGSRRGRAPEKKNLPLEQAVPLLDASELETVLLKAKTMFKDNPDLWLKDMASIMNLRLDCVQELDPLFQDKPVGYPSSLLSPQVKKVLLTTLRDCTDGVLTVFLEHCFTFMLNDMAKNVPAHGYRIFIQLLCFEKPHIALQNIDKYKELINTHQNRPMRCMSIMWGIGQAGLKDLNSGLQVWFEMMFPLLKIRSLSSYAVEYLEQLFKLHGNQKTENGIVSLRNFFPILDMVHLSQSTLPSTLLKKLRALYPKIKHIAFGSNPENRLRQFFPSFLARLAPGCTDNLRNELEECLVHCLSVDKHCFSTWMQMYTKHITQSSLLLQYILSKWETVHAKFDLKVFRETIRAFSITNEELSAQDKHPSESLSTCIAVCKELLLKMSRWQFPWGFFFLAIFGILAALLAYDVSTKGSFKRSTTARLLKDAGVLVYMEQAWHRLHLYLGKAIQWLQENVPYYYAKVCNFAGPYLQLFWTKLYEFGVYVADATKEHRAWIHKKVPELLEWVQSKVPGLWDGCSYYLGIMWEFIVTWSLWLWKYIVYYSNVAGTWIHENILKDNKFLENLQRTLVNCLLVIQSYCSKIVQWIYEICTGNKSQA